MDTEGKTENNAWQSSDVLSFLWRMDLGILTILIKFVASDIEGSC
jgi:hypothetical protein